MLMDYSQQMADLANAALICARPEHQIMTPVNGVYSTYPRWPEAWKACEVVWRWYLESKTITPDDKDDYQAVAREARRLR
jgi:hypothetical protein